MDECIDSVREARMFSSLYATSRRLKNEMENISSRMRTRSSNWVTKVHWNDLCVVERFNYNSKSHKRYTGYYKMTVYSRLYCRHCQIFKNTGGTPATH